MVTPGLAGFPLQGQSTGLSNNIPNKEDSNIPKGDDCPSYSERGPDGQHDPERIIEYFDC